MYFFIFAGSESLESTCELKAEIVHKGDTVQSSANNQTLPIYHALDALANQVQLGLM